MDLTQLADAVRAASYRPEVVEALEQAYASLQAEVDRRKPVCVVSGKCCRFEEYGHRLFVTTLELAAFLHHSRARAASPELERSIRTWDGAGCPFQVARLCGVHTFRPLGCRMFFCDATSTEWQNEQYEAFHARLKRLHEALKVPYAYMEWRRRCGR